MRLITLFLIIATAPVFAQTRLSYSEVVNVEGTKEQLFLKAKQWMAVIDFADEEAGIIEGKGAFKFTSNDKRGEHLNSYVDYTIYIDVEDGKYSLTISDFYHAGNTASQPSYAFNYVTTADTPTTSLNNRRDFYIRAYDELKTQCSVEAQIVARRLEDHMKTIRRED